MTTESPQRRFDQPRSGESMTAWNASRTPAGCRCRRRRWLSSRWKGTDAFEDACGRLQPAQAQAGSEARRLAAEATIWPRRSHTQGLAPSRSLRTPSSSLHRSFGALVIPENTNVTLAM